MKKEKPKLPKAFKKKWVAALRSGKYKQGIGSLYDANEDTYCCLGVAGKICGIDVPNLTYWDSKKINKSIIAKGLPKILIGDNNDLVSKLSNWNDGEGGPKWSFKKIAAYIERYL